MLTFRSPHLTSQRMNCGRTRSWWIVAGWLVALLIVFPVTLIVLGVHWEWFSHPNVLYNLHDEIYLPLRGWLFLQPWPYCLVPWGFVLGGAGALAIPFLVGRSPLKSSYIWCVRGILIVLSRLPQPVTLRFLSAWQKWGGSRHAAWPLVADEIRMRVLLRFDAHPEKRAWWLAELVRWTTLTLELSRLAVTPLEETPVTDRISLQERIRRAIAWLQRDTVLANTLEFVQTAPRLLWNGVTEPAEVNSGADELSRLDRIRNARVWSEAVVRLTVVSTVQASLDQAGRPALLTGQWRDVFRRGEGSLRERAALAWYLIRQQPNLEELVTWLQRDAGRCLPETARSETDRPDTGNVSPRAELNGNDPGNRCGIDFDSVSRDLDSLVPLLSELASRTDSESAAGSESDSDSAGVEAMTAPVAAEDRHSRLGMLSPESRRTLRKLAARTMQRRQLVEQTLRELEAHAFHSFASVLPADRVPVEADPDVAALCLNLALIPVMLTGEAGPLTGLVESIDAFHLMWSLTAADQSPPVERGRAAIEGPRAVPAVWTQLHAALEQLPGSDVRNYCREMQTELFAVATTSVSESVLRRSSVVRSSDLEVLRDRAALVDRVSTLS